MRGEQEPGTIRPGNLWSDDIRMLGEIVPEGLFPF